MESRVDGWLPNDLGKTSKKNTDYLVTLIQKVGRYLAEITIS